MALRVKTTICNYNEQKKQQNVCIIEIKVIYLQRKQLKSISANNKKQQALNKTTIDMKNLYASFYYFYFYFASICKAGSCV